MIHYHGTPIGGDNIEAARFLKGRHALIPFAYPINLGIALEVCQSVIFDNSAFTTWKSGEQKNGAELLKWVTSYQKWIEGIYRHPAFVWGLICDIIDGNEEDNDALLADWDRQIPGVPVWHLHESLDRLIRLCNEWPTVAFGSSGQWAMPGTPAWWRRMNAAMNAICNESGQPPCKLHGLRMLNPEIFTKLPFASADSTNAAQNNGATSRFGTYCPPTAGQRAEVIASRIEAHQSAAVWAGYQQDSMDFGLWQNVEENNGSPARLK